MSVVSVCECLAISHVKREQSEVIYRNEKKRASRKNGSLFIVFFFFFFKTSATFCRKTATTLKIAATQQHLKGCVRLRLSSGQQLDYPKTEQQQAGNELEGVRRNGLLREKQK